MGALAAADTGVWQLLTALPFRCTVQAPHWPMPQPNFVPFSFRTSRITHKRGISAGTSTVLDRPFTVSWKAMRAVSYLLSAPRIIPVLDGLKASEKRLYLIEATVLYKRTSSGGNPF